MCKRSLIQMFPTHSVRCFALAVFFFMGWNMNSHAVVLLNLSPAATDAEVLTDNLDNRSTTQNFAEDFSFLDSVSLTGMSIYMREEVATLGQSVTVRIYQDAFGVPGTKLHDFTELVAVIDTADSVGNLERVHADFTTAISIEADTTYWIGMSGTGTPTFSLAGLGDVGGSSSPYDDRTMAQFSNESFNFIGGTAAGDMPFRLEGTIIPEPGSVALVMGLASAIGVLAFRRRPVRGWSSRSE